MPHVLKLEKPGWTVYYDCETRYPVCVIESFTGSIPSAAIARRDVGEPFRADPALPRACRMYWAEYEDYMAHGGSPGHNAPAGFHKTSLADYRKTFLLSNVCPQEVVFNGGLWLLLETLCREIIAKFPRVDVYTGSIRGETRTFGASTINVPSHMYKVLVVTTAAGDVYAGAFVMRNRPATDEVPVERFYRGVRATAAMLLNASGFDLARLIRGPFKSLALVHALSPEMTPALRAHMETMRQMQRLVYARTLAELEAAYAAAAAGKPSAYQTKYYKLVRRRLRAGTESRR